MKLEELLLTKARNKELAHFYTLEAPLEEEVALEELQAFCHNFIRRYFQEIEKQTHPVNSLMDHPDVLVLTGIEEKRDYTVEDAALLEKFFTWKAVQSQRKFVVIPEAHRITQVLANKWLKILEEPPVEATIFLLNPRRIRLLPTIQSRTLLLRLPPKATTHDPSLFDGLLDDARKLSLHPFLEKYSKGDFPLRFWLGELARWEGGQWQEADKKASLEKTLRSLEEMETFNQPTATKWTFFYSHLKDHVLARLAKKG